MTGALRLVARVMKRGGSTAGASIFPMTTAYSLLMEVACGERTKDDIASFSRDRLSTG